MASRVAFFGIIVAALVIGALLGYALSSGAALNTQTSTAVAYSIAIQPLNSSRIATAGSTVDFMFNVTSPVVGPLYFYASAIPAPGSPWQMNVQNVTENEVELPPGVEVSYPTGQAVFGTNHSVLTLRVSLAPNLNGTVGLVVGAFQEVNQQQTFGDGSGFYITVEHE